MSVPTPPVLVTPFAVNGDKNVIPAVPGPTTGRASYDLGFPPQTRLPLTAGGIPPSGLDFNGIFYALSAWALYAQAGMIATYNQTFVDANGGYEPGALIRSATTTGLYWTNQLANQTRDPDADSTGWVGFRAGGTNYLAAALPAGNSNNYAPVGLNGNTGVLDLDPSAGNATLTGLAAGNDGQRVILSNVNATYSVTLAKLAGGSNAANRFRMAFDITLTPNGSVSLQYSTGAGLWIVLP